MNDRQRIMVVDDDQDMQRLLNRTLELEGFDTVIVADGDSAVNLMDKIDPDLVILDTMTPGVDSFQVIEHMREHSDVPIIMLSTGHEVESLRKALSLGADDFIRKPFGMRSFIARIRAKLRRTRQKIT
ncbi:MAG: response regulator [Dehalococcoidales bacterium]|nr:response regulator [Dehalococcoidales bacterium]